MAESIKNQPDKPLTGRDPDWIRNPFGGPTFTEPVFIAALVIAAIILVIVAVRPPRVAIEKASPKPNAISSPCR